MQLRRDEQRGWRLAVLALGNPDRVVPVGTPSATGSPRPTSSASSTSSTSKSSGAPAKETAKPSVAVSTAPPVPAGRAAQLRTGVLVTASAPQPVSVTGHGPGRSRAQASS